MDAKESSGKSGFWMVHSYGEEVSPVELITPVGYGLSTLRNLWTEKQGEGCLDVSERSFRRFFVEIWYQ